MMIVGETQLFCTYAYVFVIGRVNGVLAVSRAFGDVALKEHDERTGDLCLSTNPIVATPDVHSQIIGPDVEFAVLGTDGLFDILDPQTTANFVRKSLSEHANLQQCVASLTKEAIAHGSIDNVSAIIVVFHASQSNSCTIAI
jgi:serine/threonine protein phosphatase PrpC